MHTRRHEVIAGSFGCGLGQHRRFDVDETLVVEVAAECTGRLVTQHHVLLHLRTAQVDHTVREAHVFGQVLVVQLERRRDGDVKHFDFMAQQLDLAAGNILVLGAFRAAAHAAGHFQHVFVAHRFGNLEHVGAIRVAHHLRQAFAVAQVDEDYTAVVAAAMRPAAQGDGLAEVGNIELPAVMSSHR